MTTRLLGFIAASLAFLFALAPAAIAQPKVVRTSIAANHTAIPRGGNLVIAVVMDHDDEWHTNPNEPKVPKSWTEAGFTPWATSLKVDPLAWASQRAIQWPKPHEIEADLAATGVPEKYGVYGGRVVIFIPFIISSDAPLGPAKFKAAIEYQACAESCLPPTTDPLEVTVDILDTAGTPVLAADQKDFAGFDPANFAAAPSATATTPGADDGTETINIFGWTIQFNSRGTTGAALVLLVATFGGFLLNLTPCVLPVIPIKIMSLQQSAKSPERSLTLGLVMCSGLIAFWLAIGAMIGFSTSFKVASQLIAVWWFTMGIGFFVGIMGTGMMGAFTINLPQWVYSVDANHENAKGSFTYGILTAILALPCVAPFAGTAMGVAAKSGPAMALAIFGCIGVGMAFPYAILAAKPKWVSFVPSAGPASELLKQVMGMLMIAAAIFFIATGALSLVAEKPYLAKQLHWWLIAGVISVACIWLILQTFVITRSFARRATFTLLGALLAAGATGWAINQTNNAKLEQSWQTYSRATLDQALASGDVVVVDFTAEWCAICKTLESSVLHREAVHSVLTGPGVTPIKVDLSSLDAPGWDYLKNDLKQPGIPLLVIYGPGLKAPEMSTAYNVDWVLATIERARGKSK